MAVPEFAAELLRWRPGSRRPIPNCADADSAMSVAIASEMYRLAGVDREGPSIGEPGSVLERGVEDFLRTELPARERYTPKRVWTVNRKRVVSDFYQYVHLAQLQRIIELDGTGTLGVEIGRDYLVKPDVTVSLPGPTGEPHLHAAIACKWTIRSDRVQNIRHEGVILTRHRRGRQPHIVAVTVEPLPSRLAAIARGTGEIDCVYHLLFEELVEATAVVGNEMQRRVLHELTSQRRLAPFSGLVAELLL